MPVSLAGARPLLELDALRVVGGTEEMEEAGRFWPAIGAG